MRYLLLLCLIYYQHDNYASEDPRFAKYFEIGFIPYKDKCESDLFFWFYRPEITISDGSHFSYIGLYRVRSHVSFIKYLEADAKKNKSTDVYEMTRSAYAKYVKSEEVLKFISGKFETDVQDEVIRIRKENEKVCCPKEIMTVYNRFVERAGESKGLKYVDFMREYLQAIDYEGTFICVSPDKAETFFNEVEKNYQKKQK